MRLLDLVKVLRSELPQIKIRQLSSKSKGKYALFILPACAENMRLYFGQEVMVLEFFGSRTVYGYSESEQRYMLDEIKSLLECRTAVVSVKCSGKDCGGIIASADEINREFLMYAAKRCCIQKGIAEPRCIFVNISYCDCSLERTEYFSCFEK